MIELILGVMVMSLWAMTIPGVVADAVTTLKAAKAGEWKLIDKQRDRKATLAAARREALARAWQATRARRNRQAGGTGEYRPGMGAYLSDVYHGLWEDKLEKRRAKRAARPPVGPDGRRAPMGRIDAAVQRKVQASREKRGMAGRAWHALIDPVGEERQPQPATPAVVDERPVTDAPRVACPVCGDTITERNGSWMHPTESTCPTARRTDGGYHVPSQVSVVAADLYRLNRARGYSGALGETETARGLRTRFGDQHPESVYEQAAADATHTPGPPGGWMPQHDDIARAAHDALNNIDPNTKPQPADIAAIEAAVRRQFPHIHPEAVSEAVAMTAEARAAQHSETSRTNNNRNCDYGGTMSTDTSDLVTYNQAVAKHENALATLRAQQAEAAAFEQHITAVAAAVEAMDGNRAEVTNALAPLAEGLETSRYGADASQGSTEATTTLTAGTIADVQEHIEAARDRNQQWQAELDASAESVQASLQHIKSQYGEAAAIVQETGVDARVLEEH